ncbi:MAG: glycosyltransferase [Ferruginibacter sp.]
MKTNEILMLTSFPPRKCGIATYSQDLITAIEDKFGDTFSIKVCALLKKDPDLEYPPEVKYFLNTWDENDYSIVANKINDDDDISIIYIQHEFGLYGGEYGAYLLDFLATVNKPVITTFHTVLPGPDEHRKKVIQQIGKLSDCLIVMTLGSATILENEYEIAKEKIVTIAHGTHLIKSIPGIENQLPVFENKKILSTFGLLSEGKGIETALEALPQIIAEFPNVIYFIIGQTHPEVAKREGEKYRDFLLEKVRQLKIEEHVVFINKYLPLNILLEYLQRTDIYLFTSKDPHQAVSGTLAYAMSAGCPVISTPIPHALELLDGAGVNFDFGNATQLADAAILLLSDPKLMEEMRMNALHRISPTAWQNAAIAHIILAKEIMGGKKIVLNYKVPVISLSHLNRMTCGLGMIQFSVIAEPDKASGYTLDDNARALIAIAKHFELTGKFEDLRLINTYLNFIIFCQQTDGTFLNYVTIDKEFFGKNKDENLEDSNGRAIWALGEFLASGHLLDFQLQAKVEDVFKRSIPVVENFQSPRAIAFAIKGLHYYNKFKSDISIIDLITKLADNLVSKYRGISISDWHWYEYYLTYANSLLPEAMLFAAKSTGSNLYRDIAKESFDFLLSIIFKDGKIKVVSNRGWHHKGKDINQFGEQPIEIAYTILALDCFYKEFKDNEYINKMKITFNWFLGDNHLNQIVYNPCTGGCYDGLEEHHVNLNQGAESTVSYLLARLTIEKYFNPVIINEHIVENIPVMETFYPVEF